MHKGRGVHIITRQIIQKEWSKLMQQRPKYHKLLTFTSRLKEEKEKVIPSSPTPTFPILQLTSVFFRPSLPGKY